MGLLRGPRDHATKATKDFRFYLCGEGGQGVQLLADILMKAELTPFAYNSPWYEPEVTKARTVAAVTLSNSPYANPNPQVGEVDVLVCMTPQMYFERKHFVKKGGLVLVDSQGVDIKNEGFDYTLINVPAMNLATTQVKERRSANMVFLGALSQTLEFFKDEVMESVIQKNIPKAAEINIRAYRLGKSFLISAVKPGR